WLLVVPVVPVVPSIETPSMLRPLRGCRPRARGVVSFASGKNAQNHEYRVLGLQNGVTRISGTSAGPAAFGCTTRGMHWTGIFIGEEGGKARRPGVTSVRVWPAMARAASTESNNRRRKASITLQGKKLNFDTGKVAMLADGAVMGSHGKTVVLATVVSDRAKVGNSGFLPLQVEYREKAHATGKIPRTRDRREGQPSNEEVLVARAVDRVLRPLFPKGYCSETQVIATVQALDVEGGGDPV
ncbi:unnamed protein product, partial [Discosporangium mesarthrocarpum]